MRMNLLKEFIALMLKLTSIHILVRELFQRNRVTIIVYHTISVSLFEKHMKYLLKHYSVIPLDQFIEAKYNNNLKLLPKKAVIVTFDDGAKSTFALKDVIQKHNIPVTIFVCSDILGTMHHFWFSYIEKIDTDLKRIPDTERLELLSSVNFDEKRDYDVADSLSIEDVSDLLELGISLQSHTATHPILPMCDDLKAETEIAKSKIDIQDKFGIEVTCFAYPNGDYCSRDVSICQQSGYMAAVTMDPGFNNANTDVYRLKRLSIYENTSASQFATKVSGIWGITKGIFIRKRHTRFPYFADKETTEQTGKPITKDLANKTGNIYSSGMQ